MDPARLLRFHRARLRTRDPDVLRPRAPLGQRGARGSIAGVLIDLVSAVVDAAGAVLIAPSCAACGALLEHPSRGAVCERCWSSIAPITPPVCRCCGDPLTPWREASFTAGLCPRCRRTKRTIAAARAIGAYDGVLRRIVHAFKYDGRRSLARPLGALMRARGADVLDGAHAVVPVPLHPSRRRERGFNQAVDLAEQLALPVVHGLRRTRRTQTQAELPAAQRHRNVRDAFAPTVAARRLADAVVVLVDDVSTTGATLEACARTLKEVGVREVRALIAARAYARLR